MHIVLSNALRPARDGGEFLFLSIAFRCLMSKQDETDLIFFARPCHDHISNVTWGDGSGISCNLTDYHPRLLDNWYRRFLRTLLEDR